MNELSKPSEIFCRKIEPAFAAYRVEPLNELLANVLAHATNGQLEWTYRYYETDRSRTFGATSLSEFRRKIFEQCPDARMMWDLADADRHRLLDRKSALVTASTAAYVPDNGQLFVPAYNKTLLEGATNVVGYWRAWPD